MGLASFVVAAFRKRAESAQIAPLLTPPGFEPDLPKFDEDSADQEIGSIEPLAEFVGSSFAIIYVNAKREQSRRRITVRRVYETAAGNILLRAHCHERNAVRAFRVDRIREIVDLHTGEVHEDPLKYLGLVSVPGFVDSADDTQKLIKRCRPAFQILVFMARCDGNYHPSEHLAVMEFARDSAGDLEPDWEAASLHVVALQPDTANFYDATEYFADEASDDEAERLVRHLMTLVEADGVIHENEFEFLLEVKEAFEAAGRPIP